MYSKVLTFWPIIPSRVGRSTNVSWLRTCLKQRSRRSIPKSACVMGLFCSPKIVILVVFSFLFQGLPKIGLSRMGVFRRALSDVTAKPVTHWDQAVKVGVQNGSFSCIATCLIVSGPFFVRSVIFMWFRSFSFLLKRVE